MSHHGHEDSMSAWREQCDREALPIAQNRLSTAVALISAIAANQKADPSAACDSWLEKNGYDCEASRRRARERRAEQLDAELARLKAERDAL